MFTQVIPLDNEHPLDGDIEETVDPFYQVRNFIDQVNHHMHRLVTPGSGIIMDETMIPLHGMTLEQRVDGMPAKICLERKPEGVGFEIKDLQFNL